MTKTIFETMKANKELIIKRALIFGGATLGLAIVAKVATKEEDACCIIDDEEVDIEINDDEVTVEINPE